MPNDPFFNDVTAQLIQAPSTSRAALGARPGSVQDIPASAAFPVESAKSWIRNVLIDAYHPNDGARVMAFPMENSLCDTVRAIYKAGEYEFDIAQSRHLMSIKIRGGQFASPNRDDQKAEQMARKIFVMGDRFHFALSGPYNNGSYGKQDTDVAGRVDTEWPHWLDSMRWWSNSEEIGFILLKASGGPTMGAISAQADSNIRWFK